MPAPDRGPSTGERVELDGVTASLEPARAVVDRALVAAGLVSAELGERARLVVSELATNAVEAAPGVPFTVGLAIDSLVTITVSNRADVQSVAAAAEQASVPDHRSTRGRGFTIVRALCVDLSVSRRDVGDSHECVDVTAVIDPAAF